MLAYIIRRALATIPVMAIVALFVFSLLYIAPGDPAAVIAGDQATPADVERIRQSLGLDRPFLVQFSDWAWRLLHADLGRSIFTNLPVTTMIAQRVEPTLSLMEITLILSVTVAVPIGVLAAWKTGTWFDRAIMAFAVFGFSVPVFVVGYLLAFFFALQLEWLPVQGYTPISQGLWPWLENLILPSIALGCVYIALIARITRASMLEVLQQDYIRTARAKGLAQSPILFIHALKNASVPIVTVIGIGIALLILMVLMAVLAPYLSTVDPTTLNTSRRTREPSALYWFGTDMLGRDIYSRVVFGARVSLTVGFSVAILASIAGLAIGLVSGMVRWADGFVMRVMDGLMSIPPILLAVALMALTRGSIGNVVMAITIAEIPRVSRLVRGVVLSLREQPYVDAAVAAGTRTPMIILRHILPNTLAPMTVQATYICASAMIIEAILSFIGAGVPPITPSWGNIMAEGRALWQVKPFIVFFPAVFLSVTVLAVNLLGDGMRDALDPRLAKGL